MTKLLWTCVPALALAACADAPAVPEWQGTTPHLRVIGQIVGDDIDIDLTGAGAADVAMLYCERNYLPDGTLEKVEIKHNFTYNEQPAELELTLEGSAEPGSYTIGDDYVLEVKIETADATEYENAGESGDVVIEEFTGTPDTTTNVIPDNTGTFGGWFDAVLDDGNDLSASFTANCGVNDI